MVWTLIISGMSIQAPHHIMCSNKNLFKTINFKHKADVFMADGQKIPTTGTGDIFIQCTKHDGTNHMAKLCDVLYVPQLCGNLISVKKLVEKDLEVHFKAKLCRIIKNGETIAEATEHKGLFELNVSQKLLKVIEGHKVKYKAECIHVWHNRMGHRDQQAIRMLERQNKASGINIKPCQFS